MTVSETSFNSYDDALEAAKAVQARADRLIVIGMGFLGTMVFGLIGLPFFLRGVFILRKAERDGLAVRPTMMTFVGALVLIDGFMNTLGWMIDTFAHHSLIIRVFEMGWSLLLDNGYAWNFNNMWFGGAAAPGEKAWEIACTFVLFPIRVVAAWGFLKGKRWGLQWLIMSCWMGVFVWVGYLWNLTTFWEMRLVDIAAPVWGWWLYDIWYITPFVILPYLYTINKEMFTSD